MLNNQLAELIYNMAADCYDSPLDLVHSVTSWDDEEWAQLDPEPSARVLSPSDRIDIVARLAAILAMKARQADLPDISLGQACARLGCTYRRPVCHCCGLIKADVTTRNIVRLDPGTGELLAPRTHVCSDCFMADSLA